jgi:hypothetical protein
MFTISFTTNTVVPEDVVVLGTAADGWADRAGDYTGGAWQFVLDERDYADGLEFKFAVRPGRWMNGGNLTAPAPAPGAQLVYTDAEAAFPPDTALVTENGVVAQRLANRNLDATIIYASTGKRPYGHRERQLRASIRILARHTLILAPVSQP